MNIKKTILLITSLIGITTISKAEEHKFYLTMSDDISKFGTYKATDTLKLKHKDYGHSVSIGWGYYFANNLRAELTFLHNFSINLNGKDNKVFVGEYTTNRKHYTVFDDEKHQVKLRAESALLKLYVDIYNFDRGTTYVASGIGASKISVKHNNDYTRTHYDQTDSPTTVEELNAYDKVTRTVPTLIFGIGQSFDVTRNIKLDIEYNWIDYGHLIHRWVDMKGHKVSCSIRFDL